MTVSRSLSFTWTPPLMRVPIDTKLTLTIVFTATLYCGDKGDWPTNFSQGLGYVPQQYKDAIHFGKKAAEEAAANWNNRLSIVGHSLGGGLASAAALAAQKANPDLKISCWTYNAAGLHKKTAKAAGAKLTDACSIPVRARYVQSEILSSLQSRSPLVPFMSSLLRWSGHQMPEAVAMPFGYEGVSPGPFNLGGQSLDYAPMWGALPKLYPLEDQQLIPGAQFRYVKPVLDLAEHSPDIETFLKGVLDLLAKSVKGASLEDMEGIGGLLLDYLLPTTRKALMKDAMNKPDPDIDMAGHRRHVPYDRDASRPAWLLDWLELGRLLVASGCYHTWPPCAFTFLLDPPKQ
nr:alpha/beta hydrolase fold domain-containing protein [Marinicella sp. W31]MDC2877313.1 alpha/beta hydrolase fold domain-containing protein [Marinicella sp. W31]